MLKPHANNRDRNRPSLKSQRNRGNIPEIYNFFIRPMINRSTMAPVSEVINNPNMPPDEISKMLSTGFQIPTFIRGLVILLFRSYVLYLNEDFLSNNGVYHGADKKPA